MKKIHIDIDDEIKRKLDILKEERGMKSTNELIRFILSEYLLKIKK